MSQIAYYRGDSYETRFVLSDENFDPVDITTKTFLLTVSADPQPSLSDTPLFRLTGTVVDGPTGEFSFTPSSTDTDQEIGTYYYDVQMTEGSEVRTLVVDSFIITNDITK